MLPYRDSKLTRIVLTVFFIILVIYAYFEAQGFLFGPTIDIDTQTQNVDNQYILITGHADRIASLAVDGQPIQVTVDGDFQEPYVLSPGLNRIVFDAKDSYGRTSEKVLQIVYTPSATTTAPAIPAASSTAPTTGTSSTPR